MPTTGATVPDATYYNSYSDPEEDANSGGQHDNVFGDDDEDDDDEENDDEDMKPRRSTPLGSPHASHNPDATLGGKRKILVDNEANGRVINGNGIPGRSASASFPTSHPTVDPLSAKRMKPEPLEVSILNAEPLDEFVLQVADWIYQQAFGKQNIEVEAKVGVLLDRRSGERLNLPVLNETILSPDYPDIRFESNMSLTQHANYNRILNHLVQKSGLPTYPFAKVHYEHTRVTDSFYPASAGSTAASSSNRIRVTTDDKTQQVKECVQKIRLADLNIYSPCRKVDWRISVSQEIPAPRPMTQAVNVRKKDRISYSHQSFKIDLTQVTSGPSAAGATPELMHELELEFADATDLMKLAQVRGRGPGGSGVGGAPAAGPWNGKEGDLYDELVRVFVNNIRILVRNAA